MSSVDPPVTDRQTDNCKISIMNTGNRYHPILSLSAKSNNHAYYLMENKSQLCTAPTIFSFAVKFDGYRPVTCPLLIGVYKPLIIVHILHILRIFCFTKLIIINNIYMHTSGQWTDMHNNAQLLKALL